MINIFTDINGNIFSFKKGNKERLLTPYKHFGRSKNPYMRVKIGNKLWLQHRFVSSVLIGRKLNENEVVNHKDGNTLNNSLENLEVVSQQENVKHAVENKLYCSGYAWYKARGMI